MTVLVGAKFGGKVIIGSDTQVTSGNNRVTGFASKISQYGNYALAFCGNGPLEETFNLLPEDKLPTTIYCKNDAIDLARLIYNETCVLLKDCPNDKPEEYQVGEILICTNSKIFVIFPDYCAFEYDDYVCLGAGSDLATGAMGILYPKITKSTQLKKAVTESINVACKYNISCGLPSDVREL